jgi:hypothetical protein
MDGNGWLFLPRGFVHRGVKVVGRHQGVCRCGWRDAQSRQPVPFPSGKSSFFKPGKNGSICAERVFMRVEVFRSWAQRRAGR